MPSPPCCARTGLKLWDSVSLCDCRTVPAHSSRAPGTWGAPRDTEHTHRCRSWHNWPILVLPGTGGLGVRQIEGLSPPPLHFLQILFLGCCFRSGFCCSAMTCWDFSLQQECVESARCLGLADPGSPEEPIRDDDDNPHPGHAVGAGLPHASLPRR